MRRRKFLPERITFGQGDDVFRKLIVLATLILVAGIAFCFLPRKTAANAFHPAALAALEVKAWRLSKQSPTMKLALVYYSMLFEEYGMSPYATAKATWYFCKAQSVFFSGADLADQEKAMEPLGDFFSVISRETGREFDIQVAARLELFTWILPRDVGRRSELTTAIAEKLALIYAKPSHNFVDAAKCFSKARQLANQNNWAEAENENLAGWKKLKNIEF